MSLNNVITEKNPKTNTVTNEKPTANRFMRLNSRIPPMMARIVIIKKTIDKNKVVPPLKNVNVLIPRIKKAMIEKIALIM